MSRADLVQRVAIAILRGQVLQAAGVSVGGGILVDWREVLSGEDVTARARESWCSAVATPWGVDMEWTSTPDRTPFGLALAFVDLVGDRAVEALSDDGNCSYDAE